MNTNREKYYRVFSGKYLSDRSYDQTFTWEKATIQLLVKGFPC